MGDLLGAADAPWLAQQAFRFDRVLAIEVKSPLIR